MIKLGDYSIKTILDNSFLVFLLGLNNMLYGAKNIDLNTLDAKERTNFFLENFDKKEINSVLNKCNYLINATGINRDIMDIYDYFMGKEIFGFCAGLKPVRLTTQIVNIDKGDVNFHLFYPVDCLTEHKITRNTNSIYHLKKVSPVQGYKLIDPEIIIIIAGKNKPKKNVNIKKTEKIEIKNEKNEKNKEEKNKKFINYKSFTPRQLLYDLTAKTKKEKEKLDEALIEKFNETLRNKKGPTRSRYDEERIEKFIEFFSEMNPADFVPLTAKITELSEYSPANSDFKKRYTDLCFQVTEEEYRKCNLSMGQRIDIGDIKIQALLRMERSKMLKEEFAFLRFDFYKEAKVIKQKIYKKINNFYTQVLCNIVTIFITSLMNQKDRILPPKDKKIPISKRRFRNKPVLLVDSIYSNKDLADKIKRKRRKNEAYKLPLCNDNVKKDNRSNLKESSKKNKRSIRKLKAVRVNFHDKKIIQSKIKKVCLPMAPIEGLKPKFSEPSKKDIPQTLNKKVKNLPAKPIPPKLSVTSVHDNNQKLHKKANKSNISKRPTLDLIERMKLHAQVAKFCYDKRVDHQALYDKQLKCDAILQNFEKSVDDAVNIRFNNELVEFKQNYMEKLYYGHREMYYKEVLLNKQRSMAIVRNLIGQMEVLSEKFVRETAKINSTFISFDEQVFESMS